MVLATAPATALALHTDAVVLLSPVDTPDHRATVDIPGLRVLVDTPSLRVPVDIPSLRGPVDTLGLRGPVDIGRLHRRVGIPSLHGLADILSHADMLVTHTVTMCIRPVPMISTVVVVVVDMAASVPSPAASCSKDVSMGT